MITNIAGNALTLATAVATTAGQTVANGAVVSLVVRHREPDAVRRVAGPGRPATRCSSSPRAALTRGGLTLRPAGGTAKETLIDDAGVTATTLMNAASGEDSRLLYVDQPADAATCASAARRGHAQRGVQQDRRRTSTAILVSLPDDRQRHDPDPRLDATRRTATSDYVTEPITPGHVLQARTSTCRPRTRSSRPAAGSALMVLSSDREYTIRPAPGTQLTLDLAGSSFTLPIVGGAKALATATGGDLEEAPVGGTVPATLALTLGAPAAFGAFTPGVAQDYTRPRRRP